MSADLMSEIDPSNLRIFVRQQLLPPPRIKMSEMIAFKWPPASSLILNWSFSFFSIHLHWTLAEISFAASWSCAFLWHPDWRQPQPCCPLGSLRKKLLWCHFWTCFFFFFNVCLVFSLLKRHLEHDHPVVHLSSSELVAFRKCQRLRLPPRLRSHITARLSSSLLLRCLAVVGWFNPRLQRVPTRPLLKPCFFFLTEEGNLILRKRFHCTLIGIRPGNAGRCLLTAPLLLTDAVNDGSWSAVTDLEFIWM